MPLPPIVKLANGRIDAEYEREIATLWLNEKRIQWNKIIDNTKRNFYILKNEIEKTRFTFAAQVI